VFWLAGMSTLLYYAAEKSMLYWRRGYQFSCLPFDLATPDIVVLTSTVFVCLIILLIGNSLFCFLAIKIFY